MGEEKPEQEESAMTARYRTEGYVSEILIGKSSVCAVKLKPTDEFVVKVPETNSELIALIGMQKADEGKIVNAERSFPFSGKCKAVALNCEFILSLKQQHVKLQFCFNENDEIVAIAVK